MKTVKAYTIAILFSLVFISCEVTDVEIADRIQMFEDDLNSDDRSGIWNNFSSTATANYSNLRTTTYWDNPGTWQQSYRTFDISVSVAGDTASGTLTRNGAADVSIVFDMVSEKSGFTTTWYIDNVHVGGATVISNIGM